MLAKYICLCVLVVQTVSNVFLVRRSRAYEASVPVIVLCQELLKLLTCLLVMVISDGWNRTVSVISNDVIRDPVTTLKVGVPAFLYIVQNQLLFVALAHLDPTTYQITYQLKILTTALCSVALLRKQISGTQWFSLCLLAAGVVLVQWKDASPDAPDRFSFIGLGAIVCATLTSGFAGVSFELMLKSTNKSIWLRNFQLALCSCVVGLGNVMLTQREHIATRGLLYDFNSTILAVILSQAYGGILIGLVVKYSDNIVKVFATSLSILLSSLLSILYLKELAFTMTFGMGLVLVLAASVLYSLYPAKKKAD